MECKLCGSTIKRMTVMHLRGSKCKPFVEGGERLTVAQYQKEFGMSSAGLNGPRNTTPSKRKSVLTIIDSLDQATIAAEIRGIDVEIAVLVNKKRKLQAIAGVLPNPPNVTPCVSPTTELDEAAPPANVGIKIFTYLDAAGSAGIGAISRGVGMSSTEVRPILNQLVDEGKLKMKNGSYLL